MLPDEAVINNPPVLIYGDFMTFGAPIENRIYEEIKDTEKLKSVLQVSLLQDSLFIFSDTPSLLNI